MTELKCCVDEELSCQPEGRKLCYAGFAEDVVARGINIKKGGNDPPLKPIDEYPDWVQTLSVPPKTLYELKRKMEAVGQDNLEWSEVSSTLFTSRTQKSSPHEVTMLMALQAVRYVKLDNRATVKQQNSLKAKK